MLYPYKRSEAAKLLAGDDTFVTVLLAILLPQYNDDLFKKDTAVLFKEIEEDFMCKLSEENENKINAAITCMTTDLFYNNVNVFTSIALAFNEGDIGGIPDGDDEELDAGEALWAIFEANLICGGDNDELRESFSAHVQHFIDHLIGSMAEDEEEIDDSVDTIEEAVRTPYFQEIIEENCKELAKQLISVGMNKDVVAEFLENNQISV